MECALPVTAVLIRVANNELPSVARAHEKVRIAVLVVLIVVCKVCAVPAPACVLKQGSGSGAVAGEGVQPCT